MKNKVGCPKGTKSWKKGMIFIKKIITKCLNCKIDIIDYPSAKRKYCTKLCSTNYQIGKENLNQSKAMIKAHKNKQFGYKKGQLIGDKNYAKLPESRRKISRFAKEHNNSKRPEVIIKIKEKRKHQKRTYEPSTEKIIQKILTNLDITWIKHKYIDIKHGYQVDLLLPEYNIIIECDGDYWHNYPNGNEIDKIRTRELQDNGYKVLRFWERDIKNNIDYCIKEIKNAIK